MKSMAQLWQNARQVVGRGLRQADAQVNGTPRARALYVQMNEPERAAMGEIVKGEFGQRAWDDFVQTVSDSPRRE